MKYFKIGIFIAIMLCGATAATFGDGKPLNILGLFPFPGISHFNFFHQIMRSLAEAGHNVTVVSFFPDKNPPAGYTDLVFTGAKNFTSSFDMNEFLNPPFYHLLNMFFLIDYEGRSVCNLTLNSDALQQVLSSDTKYDVILTEQFNSDCMLPVAHILKAPVIGLSSSALMPWYYERMGVPIIPSYIPSLFSTSSSANMNFVERVHNYVNFHLFRILYDWIATPATDELVRAKFGKEMPSVGELAKQISMMFLNQHFSLSGPKPLPPSVIELGGIHMRKLKPLNAEFQKFLDTAENGAILVSWGSVIRGASLSTDKRNEFLKALGQLKQKVIWKWENDTLPNKPSNLLISHWLPQLEILCHPNVKAFISHGGLGGSSEAVYCGVPVVVMPIYGDQFQNAAALKSRGMGTVLKFEDITEQNVLHALRTVLDNKYQDNAKAVSRSYRNRPQNAKETAVWWVEYVARTQGAPLLRSHAVVMPRFIYYSFDIYFFFICVVLAFSLCGRLLFKKLFSYKSKQLKTKNE